jgi:gas vesicle protein
MIKKFSEFINEAQSPIVSTESGLYGDILFESISKDVVDSLTESINEGRITLEDNLLNEGFLTNLFKIGAGKAKEAEDVAKENKEQFKNLSSVAQSAGDLIKLGLSIKKEEVEEDVWKLISDLCDSAAKMCEKINEKEDELNQAITKKFNDSKQAIAEFAGKAKDTFVKIAEKSKNAVKDTLNAMAILLSKIASISVEALKKAGKFSIITISLPIVLTMAVYRSAKKVVTKLCEKVKDIWEDVQTTLELTAKYLQEWIKTQINAIKDKLKEWNDKAKEEGEKAVKAVAKAYLYVVNVCGLAIDKVKGDVKDAYVAFVDSAKEYGTQVKDYISDRANKITTWTKEKSGEFADAVKDVWNTFKDKVTAAVQSTEDFAVRMKDYAGEKVDDVEKWGDSKKKSFAKTIVAWAVKNWGEDEIKSWV